MQTWVLRETVTCVYPPWLAAWMVYVPTGHPKEKEYIKPALAALGRQRGRRKKRVR
jgi:hypothetical protein